VNILDTLKKATNILKNHKIKTPYIDSEILLSELMNIDKKYIILNPKQNVTKKFQDAFYRLIERRKKGEPIAYLTNKKEFWKHVFYVDRNVLIPRPDTETIVEQILKIYSKESKLQILDIGTGSGCILLTLLKERANFNGTGIDISSKCIKVSKYNAKMLDLTNRVRFYNSDVDNFRIGKYDVVVSNPPYIEPACLKYLDKEVSGFEPSLALNGGFDGFSKIRKVIKNAAVLIKKNGKLFLEIGFDQKIKVIEILKNEGFYINKIIKDYGNNDRCIISTKI